MDPRQSQRVVRSIVVAACMISMLACEESRSPGQTISFNPIGASSAAACTGLTGIFFTPSIFIVNVDEGTAVTFSGSPALLLGFADRRFTATTSADGLPPITNVGSFSISGGYVIFGERPLVPGLSSAAQRFNCEFADSRLVLVNNDALFDFGLGGFQRARVRVELARR